MSLNDIGQEVFDPSEAEDEEQSTRVRYAITSYGADYPVDGLVKRLDRGDIYVPEFQRKFVWTHAQASRFIESLLLGLPRIIRRAIEAASTYLSARIVRTAIEAASTAYLSG